MSKNIKRTTTSKTTQAVKKYLFEGFEKISRAKGYYKLGNLFLKDTKGRTELHSQIRVTDPKLIKYLYELDTSSGGGIKPNVLLGLLAETAFRQGLRVKLVGFKKAETT